MAPTLGHQLSEICEFIRGTQRDQSTERIFSVSRFQAAADFQFQTMI